jgi:hypothetical protein
VQALAGRRDVLEVGEHAAGLEQLEDLGVERALALVLEVVDRHRRHDRVEAPERGQRLGQVVGDDLDAFVAREALARRAEHEVGEVEPDAEHPRTVGPEQREQAPVAGAEVEDARRAAGDVVEQDALALGAPRVLVRARQVAADVLGGRPLLGGHGRTLRRARLTDRNRK